MCASRAASRQGEGGTWFHLDHTAKTRRIFQLSRADEILGYGHDHTDYIYGGIIQNSVYILLLSGALWGDGYNRHAQVSPRNVFVR